jgi:hypothetical protein
MIYLDLSLAAMASLDFIGQTSFEVPNPSPSEAPMPAISSF